MCPKNDYIYRNDIIDAMSFYDILTIVIFLGLPVVSAVISAKEKKNKSKKPLQGGQEHGEDIKDIFKSILAEMNGETPSQTEPWSEPVVIDPKPAPAAVQAPALAAAPVAENSGMRVRETETRRPEGLRPASRKVEEVSEKPVMEKIDPKKLIIYDAILNPKFKD